MKINHLSDKTYLLGLSLAMAQPYCYSVLRETFSRHFHFLVQAALFYTRPSNLAPARRAIIFSSHHSPHPRAIYDR